MIEMYRQGLEKVGRSPVSTEQAVPAWYEEVYQPETSAYYDTPPEAPTPGGRLKNTRKKNVTVHFTKFTAKFQMSAR